MKQYRLGSTEMVSAPGMVRWAINGAKFKERREAQMIKVIIDGWEHIGSGGDRAGAAASALHHRGRDHRLSTTEEKMS